MARVALHDYRSVVPVKEAPFAPVLRWRTACLLSEHSVLSTQSSNRPSRTETKGNIPKPTRTVDVTGLAAFMHPSNVCHEDQQFGHMTKAEGLICEQSRASPGLVPSHG